MLMKVADVLTTRTEMLQLLYQCCLQVYFNRSSCGVGTHRTYSLSGGTWDQTQGLEPAWYPSVLPAAVINTGQKQLGEGSKGFIWFILPSHTPVLHEVRADAEEERAWSSIAQPTYTT